MKNIQKNKKLINLDIKELRHSERIFQVNRDTYLIYVALEPSDLRPFLRVGAGDLLSPYIASQIGNVILMSTDPNNIGKELEWIKQNTLSSTNKTHYIGLKSNTENLYRFVQQNFSKNKKNIGIDEDTLPIEVEQFGPPKLHTTKDKVTVNQMEAGSFVVHVGSSKVFDSNSIQKGKMKLDDEYAFISAIFEKGPSRFSSEKEKSFIWLGEENSNDNKLPFLCWNIQGNLALVNPCYDYHYILLQERINPNATKVFFHETGLSSGFIEGIRHHNAIGKEVTILNSQESTYNYLKNYYSKIKIHNASNASHIPLIPNVTSFLSRNNSHLSFSWAFQEGKNNLSQILFPYGNKKPRRTFDVIRAPHDVEIQIVNSNDEDSTSLAHIALQIPGDISKFVFENKRLKTGYYPLVPHKEYIFHESLQAKTIATQMLNLLENEPYYTPLNQFIVLHFSSELKPKDISKGLKILTKLRVPFSDISAHNNIWNCLELVKILPAYVSQYTPWQKKLLQTLALRYSLYWISYKRWLRFEKRAVVFHLFLLGGAKTFLLAKKEKEDLLKYQFPPSFSDLENTKIAKDVKRAYSRQLRTWEKFLDRSEDKRVPFYRSYLNFLQKLYDEKLRLLEERSRFFNFFISTLGVESHLNSETEKKTKPKKFPISLDFFSQVKNLKVSEVVSRSSTGLARWIMIGIGGFFVIYLSIQVLSFLGKTITKTITTLGDSDAEIQAISLVAPGSIQKASYVPGENDIATPVLEISQYVKVLASKNNFTKKLSSEEKKNIDLVFPGDTLRLPDTRITKIKQGDYVWDIARVHYRKDFARLKILERQMLAIQKKENLSLANRRREIRSKQRLMKRLAVTTKMRRFVSNTNEKIKI